MRKTVNLFVCWYEDIFPGSSMHKIMTTKFPQNFKPDWSYSQRIMDRYFRTAFGQFRSRQREAKTDVKLAMRRTHALYQMLHDDFFLLHTSISNPGFLLLQATVWSWNEKNASKIGIFLEVRRWTTLYLFHLIWKSKIIEKLLN